jgi:folate-dependent phosphoribosylglycinamide formyltransferase PurN
METSSQNPPIRIGYLTSFREIYGPEGGEFVGQQVTDPETNEDLGYRMGNLEFLARHLHEVQSELSEWFELALIVHDDTDAHMETLGINPSTEYQEGNWPWPHRLEAANGTTVHEATRRVPMYTDEWRAARRGDRKVIRAEREQALSHVFREHQIDLILTDSLTYIFQARMAMLQNFAGRIVNFHPAITRGPSALPGLYPTESALLRMRNGQRRGHRGRIVDIPEQTGYNHHGSTMHFTTAGIDEGPIIHAQENIIIQPNDTRQSLRHRSFPAGQDTIRQGLEKLLQTPAFTARVEEARAQRVQS